MLAFGALSGGSFASAVWLAASARAAAPAGTDGAAWIENQTYKLRYEGIQRCGPADGSGGVDKSLPQLFGFAIRVAPKVGKLFVAPRDVSLALGGVILQPIPIDTSPPARKPPAKCAPLLAQQDLRTGQSARGYVLFELPPSFLSAKKPLTLWYRPTRWGGAPLVEVSIPPCLADCAPPPAAKRE